MYCCIAAQLTVYRADSAAASACDTLCARAVAEPFDDTRSQRLKSASLYWHV
jgi:hypothetical protein